MALRAPLLPIAGIAAAMIALAVWWCLQQAMTVPYLGLRFEAAPERGLLVRQVDPEGPAAGGFAPGDVVTAVRAAGQAQELAFEADDLIEEPDFFRHYEQYNRFFERQEHIHAALQSGAAEFRRGDGWVRVEPAPQRPIGDLPFMFWFQVAFAVICLAVAVGVFAMARGVAPLLYLLSGFGFFMLGLTAAIYSTRELALDGAAFKCLSQADDLGALLFTGAYLSLMWWMPQRLSRFPFEWIALPGFLAIWAGHALQWFPDLDWGFRMPMLIALSCAAGLSAVQWRRARGQPVERAALRWFFFVWFSGAALFSAVIFVPILIGLQPLAAQGWMLGWLTLIFLVVPLGITRHRLFQLERWWLGAWASFVGGIAVFALDAVLVLTFRFNEMLAAATSLAVIGWLYFPLRVWLWTTLTRDRRRQRAERYTEATRQLTGAGDRVERWVESLRHVFRPADLLRIDGAGIAAPTVAEDGLKLLLPRVADAPALALIAAEGGSRLFDNEDVQIATTLVRLLAQTAAAFDSLESMNRELERRVQLKTAELESAHAALSESERRAAVAEERERIYRDLHDDVGAKLLSLAYRAPDARSADLARSALQDLRDTVSQRPEEQAALGDALADWRAECQQRLDATGIELDWQEPEERDTRILRPEYRSALGRVLREALSNAIRHARPVRVQVRASVEDGWLCLRLRHDGEGADPCDWTSGRGMSNMQLRVRSLGGSIAWQRCEQEFETRWQVPFGYPDTTRERTDAAGTDT